MRNTISAYCAEIGRRGGRASTPAKRAAARRNALKRWRHQVSTAALPLEELRDGVWYRGCGRNATIGLWDAQAGCFWTVAFNDFAMPATLPSNFNRKVRLKREEYFESKKGTFKPVAPVGS